MVTDAYWLDQAIKIARRSTNRRHMTGCILVDESDYQISNGWSHRGTWRDGELYSTHAENHAVMRGAPVGNLVGAVAFIATVARKSGRIRSAAPCLSCANTLVAFGITTAIYTIPHFGGPDTYGWETINIPDAILTADLKVYEGRSADTA